MIAGVMALAAVAGSSPSAGTGQVLEEGGKPYDNISARNIFGLVPPPQPPSPESLKPPLPKLIITGITTILGNKRVLLKLPPGTATKPGEPARAEQSYILTEGQREGDIQVLSINEVAGSVTLTYGGTETTLTLEKDGPKAPTGPPTPPGMNPVLMGRVAMPAPTPIPAPSVLPAPSTAPSPTGAVPGLPEGFRRPLRSLQPAGTTAAPNPGESPAAPLLLPQ